MGDETRDGSTSEDAGESDDDVQQWLDRQRQAERQSVELEIEQERDGKEDK